MTIIFQESGYAEEEYGRDPYATGFMRGFMGFQATLVIQAQDAIGMQAEGHIADKQHSVGMQSELNVRDKLHVIGMQSEAKVADKEHAIGMQAHGQIVNRLHVVGAQSQGVIKAEDAFGMQAEGVIKPEETIGMQAHLQVVDKLKPVGFQAEQDVDISSNIGMQGQGVIQAQDAIGVQAHIHIVDKQHPIGMQAEGVIVNKLGAIGWEAKQDTLIHIKLGIYGEEPYGSTGYAMERYLAIPGMQSLANILDQTMALGMQAEAVIKASRSIGMQAEGHILDKLLPIGMQAEGHIIDKLFPIGMQAQGIIQASDFIAFEAEGHIRDRLRALGMQALQVKGVFFGMQANIVLYNTTNLRILCDFPSRGTTGNNWTANSTEPGDFLPSNLNTDIVEQIWRTASGIKTGVILDCDTEVPQGIFLDTLAILNHNITTSANLTLQGSDNPTHSPTGVSIPVVVTEENTFYIAPDVPNQGYRYWRLLIEDPTNTDDHVSIGTIVFGAAKIIQGENFVDDVLYGERHFSDKVFTEGFTNVANDRTTKKFIKLGFDRLDYGKGNYNTLRDIFRSSRTTLKCLWIPTPQDPTRLAVFGKLTEIPQQNQRNMGSGADLVSFDVEVDESL